MGIESQNHNEGQNSHNNSNIGKVEEGVKSKVHNIVNNPEFSTEDIKKLTDAFEVIERVQSSKGGIESITKTLVEQIGDTSVDIENIFTNEGLNNLRKLIIEELDFLQPFTNGQEGEIYKIEIGEKEYVIAKKRYFKGGDKEFNFQEQAYEIANNSKSNVKIPRPIDFFLKGDDEYLVMEYIEGKTLYTMVWEKIINQQLLLRARRLLSNPKNQYLKLRFDDFISYYAEGKRTVDFINDSDCEEGVIELLSILHEAGDIKIDSNPTQFERDPNNPKVKKLPMLEKIYNEYSKKIALFSNEERDNITTNIRTFLNDFHDAGYYHRDLGGNPRNIMFTNNKGNHDTYIIDFGRGLETDNKDYNYFDDLTGGEYDRDSDIITRIRNFKCLEEIIEDDGTYDLDTEKLAIISKELGVNVRAEDIETNIHYRKSSMKRAFINNLNIVLSGGKHDLSDLISDDRYGIKQKRNTFFTIIYMTKEEKENLKEIVTPLLSLRKNTKKYKIGKLLNDYLEALS